MEQGWQGFVERAPDQMGREGGGHTMQMPYGIYVGSCRETDEMVMRPGGTQINEGIPIPSSLED